MRWWWLGLVNPWCLVVRKSMLLRGKMWKMMMKKMLCWLMKLLLLKKMGRNRARRCRHPPLQGQEVAAPISHGGGLLSALLKLPVGLQDSLSVLVLLLPVGLPMLVLQHAELEVLPIFYVLLLLTC